MTSTSINNEGKVNFIKEGFATIHQSPHVFYNKVQVFNRDLSVAFIQKFVQKYHKDRPIKLLEALAATGLRSLRYALEIPGIQSIIANDLSEEAAGAIKAHIKLNKIQEGKIIPNQGDANTYMWTHPKEFEIIDLDPFGSAIPFLEAAVSTIKDDGLLCVTCTDMAVLAGSNMGSCYSKYGSIPLKMEACHELALRILIQSIHQIASRQKKVVRPMLCCSVDFYIRCFVQIQTFPQEALKSMSKSSHLLKCVSCEAFYSIPLGHCVVDGTSVKCVASDLKIPSLSPSLSSKEDTLSYENNVCRCSVCRSKVRMGGPFWNGPLFDSDFLGELLDHLETINTPSGSNNQIQVNSTTTIDKAKEDIRNLDNEIGSNSNEEFATLKRMKGLLTVMKAEFQDTKYPLFYDIPTLLQSIKAPPIQFNRFRSAIVNAGYSISLTHCSASGLKTNCPPEILYEILRAYWIEQKGPVESYKGAAKHIEAILKKSPLVLKEVNWAIREEAKLGRQHTGFALFMPNQEENWGPGTRPRRKRNKMDEEKEVDNKDHQGANNNQGKQKNQKTKHNDVVGASSSQKNKIFQMSHDKEEKEEQ